MKSDDVPRPHIRPVRNATSLTVADRPLSMQVSRKLPMSLGAFESEISYRN